MTTGGDSGQRLEDHHIHPQAILAKHPNGYSRDEINDLANIAFISGRANRNISNRPPIEYFLTLSEKELRAHIIPLDEELRHPENYRDFLAKRRKMLAREITQYLDQYRPSWLDAGSTQALPSTSRLKFIHYKNPWDLGKIIVEAEHEGRQWSAVVSTPGLLAVLDAAEDEFDFDDEIPADETSDNEMEINVGGENVYVHVEDNAIHIQFGPFLVCGTIDEWRQAARHRRGRSRPLSECPENSSPPWEDEPLPFPVTKIS